jgi:flagellar biosynthesis chaperone FliJ|tara:strand:+ start:809 stop:961 length:153 start_codon:yes stop_codon:yes gene_type:complete
MTNKEALELVLELAEKGEQSQRSSFDKSHVHRNIQAIFQMEDYYNDVMED